MTKPWKLLEQSRLNAFDSHKYIFDANTQGTGKSWSWISILLNRNKYNIFIDNTHELNDEINLGMLYNYNIDIGNNPAIINLFGKNFDKISPILQREMGYPRCMCNFYEDPDYYLKRLNYFPSEWCRYPEKIKDEELKQLNKKELRSFLLKNREGHCPYIYECKHKEMVQEAINSLKDKSHPNISIIWLMVKAYLDTDLIDTFLKVSKPIGTFDENILKLCYEQITLNANSIIKFNRLAAKLVERNYSLKEVWKPFKDILKLISNYLTFDKDEEAEKKAKDITKAITNFLGSFKIREIVEWNKKFKEVALKNIKEIKGTFNIMDYFIQMLNENKNDVENFEQNLSMDNEHPEISLFISKVERIRSIVQRFYKLIFTDAMLPTFIKEMIELLQIGDDYEVLHNESIRGRFKEVRVLKLNKERGNYSRNTLLNLTGEEYSDAFYKLIKYSRDIIQFEAERDRNIGLIGVKKEFKLDVKKQLDDVIKKYKSNVYFEHYDNAEGKNCYSDVYWIILFGGYNTPLRVRNILSKIVGIDMNKLEYLHGAGALKQMAHRGRELLRPDMVSLYSLTNEIKGIFEEEEEFFGILQIKYKNLLDWIGKQNGVTTKEVEEYLNKPKQSVLNILKKLMFEGLLKKEKLIRGVGSPSWFWKIR